MNRFLILLAVFSLTITSCEDFLDKPPTTGLSDDKLIDITSMEALVNGAYANVRDFLPQYSLYGTAMVRDDAAEYQQFVDHQLSTNMIGWIYGSSYVALGLVNRVAMSNLDEMEGTLNQKNAVLGDMHFLRALLYFELNQHFTLPTTGLSVPLVTEPIGVNDRVVCSASDDIKAFIEQEIENARQRFESSSGIADYFAATALAARIYFYHEKYDLAYQRANEVIEQATRRKVVMYPEIALRELIANAIIHQDLSERGTSPVVEVYADRIEIINPGKPLIDTKRFIDHPPQSRNEALAGFMRRINFCEERGSGVDKVINSIEIYQLPAPEFVVESNFMKVTLFSHKSLREMDKGDKIRACYQHCCLKYVSKELMTNETLRKRLNIKDENYPMASRIIKDSIEADLIKKDKGTSYIPFWA